MARPRVDFDLVEESNTSLTEDQIVALIPLVFHTPSKSVEEGGIGSSSAEANK